uniref:Uncharacterized protein n=1 Tax=Parascaris equorum TaxID=6256 RepID=A0A914RVV1_PAREQ
MFNPRDEYQILVVYLSGNPVVEDVKAKQQKEIRFHGTGDDQVGDVTVATFDRRGKFIVTGTSKGRIAFYDSKTIQMITYVKQNALHQHLYSYMGANSYGTVFPDEAEVARELSRRTLGSGSKLG